MDKHTVENFKLLALPGAALGVLLWIVMMFLSPFILFYTLGGTLMFITIDELERK